MIVAIDGPAGAGKSTIARRVADRTGFLYIDTGAMYRAVALAALRAGVALEDEAALARIAEDAQIELGGGVRLNGEDISEAIRTPVVSQAASKVSAAPGVRAALVRKQQAMGASACAVMEGRDIGTVVFPGAEVKVFLTATPEERARRRVEELRAKGIAAEVTDVAREMRERDLRDSTREVSPLRRADDAIEVDTTGWTLEQVEAAVLRLVEVRMAETEERAT
jgi:cytidylate kinase